MKITTPILVTSAIAFLAGPALAADYVITQSNKQFSERKMTIAAGEAITFLNDDSTTHNVHSLSEGNEFDLGAQPPGETFTKSFAVAGKVKVRCAIHPKMKIDITVE